jgi:beta-glucosidase-like glycosyl hydrolase
MISYNSVNYVSNAFNSLYLSGFLRDDIGFKGFTLSDYNDVVSSASLFMPRTYFNMTEQQGWATMVNGGTDMFMISG